MAQMTLLGEKKLLWYCIHCEWKGYETLIKKQMIEYGFKENRDFNICPLCAWVCYNEKEIDESLTSCYPILKKKVR